MTESSHTSSRMTEFEKNKNMNVCAAVRRTYKKNLIHIKTLNSDAQKTFQREWQAIIS